MISSILYDPKHKIAGDIKSNPDPEVFRRFNFKFPGFFIMNRDKLTNEDYVLALMQDLGSDTIKADCGGLYDKPRICFDIKHN
uniref:Uncharacterized protein n=1 Tax=Panagrolaimus sp. JU765 TaxID=591449 RepID=A0AC34Q8F4_9BILA